MPTIERWALVACFRFTKNDDDEPTPEELTEMQTSLDDAFGAHVPSAFAKHKIDDNAENRALVFLLAVPAAGSNKTMLDHGCKLFRHINPIKPVAVVAGGEE
jgi:hypothetical protein